MSPRASLDSTAASVRAAIARRSAPTGARLPVSALRMELDERSQGARWVIHPDGVLGRALLMPAPGTASFPLALGDGVQLRTRLMLLPHDWRDGRGALTATIAATGPESQRLEVWTGALRSLERRGRPRGHRIACQLPSWSTRLELTLHPGSHRHRAVARAIWLDPTLIDPSAPPAPAAAPEEPAHPGQLPTDAPLISVLTPVHNPPLSMLEEAIASVRQQTFAHWELCLVDDGSSDPEITAALERHASEDPRIHVARREQAGGISTATNAALSMATGTFVALLDHDDTLAPDALADIARTIEHQPDLDMIYTDEDVVGAGGPPSRHLKPGWSPEAMASLMYTCHVGVYRRSLALELGGFQSRFDGCQDYDFVLRLAERTDRIAHIPRILYHWRAHAASTAGVGGEAKPHAYLRQPAAITEHMQRRGVDAEVQFAHLPGVHRIVHRVDPQTSVAIVLAIGDQHGLGAAAASWLAQAHPTWHVVLAGAPDLVPIATSLLTTAGLEPGRLTAIPTAAPPACALATAAGAAEADHLLLMQTPAMGLTRDWLTRLIGYSGQPDIAAAGPVVLAGDGRIEHAGIAIPQGIPLPLHHGRGAAEGIPTVANLAALSGVLMTRRAIFQELGGLDAGFGDLALVEYCLRAADRGGRIVIVPDARLRTTTPDRTVNDLPTLWRLRQAWARGHTHDPYYNPNYLADRGDFIPRPV